MQTAKSDRRNYYYHLNGLKGLACLMILLAHYQGIYKYSESFLPAIPVFDLLDHSVFSSLFDEFWLFLFFVVSGYLVSKSRVASLQDLIAKSIQRFFRFAFPILFSYLVIYLICVGVGFHTAETGTLFCCDWFQGAYPEPLTIRDVVVSPFSVLLAGNARMNGSYWVLRAMFFSSLLIYLLRFLCVKWKAAEHPVIMCCILLLVTALSYFVSEIMAACLVGMLLSLFENSIGTSKRSLALCLIMSAVLVVVLPGNLKYVVFQAAWMPFLPRLRFVYALLSSGPAQWLGKSSWGIFSFHWPVICSFGALSLLRLSMYLGLRAAYLLSFFVVLIVTLAISVTYSLTLERLAARLTKTINDCVVKILNQ